MKPKFAKVPAICMVLVGLLLASVCFAQDVDINIKRGSTVKDNYIISAKAGGVNFVSGEVTVARGAGKTERLEKGDEVGAREKVLTGAGGKVEVLLNPGSFIRLGGSSDFEFLTTHLDDLQVRLNSGSAIFEVLATEEFRVAVSTPKSLFYIVKSGVYRVDALEDGRARLEVWKGRAEVGGGGKGKIIKAGQTAVLSNADAGAQLAVAKFDRDQKDEFYLWSRDRARELDKINAKLRGREVDNALLASSFSGGWNIRSGFGVWVRDPFSRSYCFLPFGWGWSSPYGHTYDRSLWNYQRTVRTVNPVWNNPSYGGNPGGNNNPPPYTSIQPGNNDGGGGGRSLPGYTPPQAPVGPPPSSPMPTGPSMVDRKEVGTPSAPIRDN